MDGILALALAKGYTNKAKSEFTALSAAGLTRKGSVATRADLPASPEQGWVYAIVDEKVMVAYVGNSWLDVIAKGDAGPQGPAGENGEDGAAGFSPSASVSKVGHTATISITDKSGTTTAEIHDGENGAPGLDGIKWFNWNTVTWDELAAEYAVNKNIGIYDYSDFAHLSTFEDEEDYYAEFEHTALGHNNTVFTKYRISSTSHNKTVRNVPKTINDYWMKFSAHGTEETTDFEVDCDVDLETLIYSGKLPAIDYKNVDIDEDDWVTEYHALIPYSHIGTIEIDGTPVWGVIFAGHAVLDETLQTHDIIIVFDWDSLEWRLFVDKSLLDNRIDARISTNTFITSQTTAPTAAATDGGIHLVYLTSEPTTKYEGYIYLIKEA